METEKTTRYTLTPDEIKDIIIEKFGLPKDAIVEFYVKGFEDPDDWSGSYGLDYRMSEVIITVMEK